MKEREKNSIYAIRQWQRDNVKTYILIIKHVIDIAISIVFTDDDKQRPGDICARALLSSSLAMIFDVNIIIGSI